MALLSAAALLYALPLFKNPSYWGKPDWDQFTFWNAVPRETLLRHGQFPLWNPFSDGGNVMLALPHSSFLSPLYLGVLLFGPVLGLKVQWAACLLLGLLGMHALSRRLGMGRLSSHLPPLVFMLSSLYSLHLREGHVEWTVMGLMPWAYLSSLKAREDPRFLVATAAVLSLMIYSGGVYVFAMTAAFLTLHASLLSWRERRAAPALGLAGALVLAFLLSAPKVLPMLELLRDSPRPTKDAGRLEAVLLPKLLLLRDQNGLYEDRSALPGRLGMDWDREGWHEFGVYVGLAPLALALLGLSRRGREHWALAWTGAACLWISMGRTAWFVDLWALLHRLPVYRSLQVPSRFLACVLFCLALFAGLGLSELERAAGAPWRRRLAAVLLLTVLLDLLAVTRPIVAGAFPIPPLPAVRAAEFRQDGSGFEALRAAGSNSAMYPALLANRGVIDAYSIVSVPRGAVKDARDPGYRGEAYLAGAGGRARLVRFSPNEVVVAVEADREDVLVLNQNHHRGWRVEADGRRSPALSRDGLLAAPVRSGARTVVFRYRPGSLLAGLLLFAAGLGASAAALRRRPR